MKSALIWFSIVSIMVIICVYLAVNPIVKKPYLVTYKCNYDVTSIVIHAKKMNNRTIDELQGYLICDGGNARVLYFSRLDY